MAGDTKTLTYLFSDLEGSTRLWEDHPDAMHGALARHDALLREAVEGAGGEVVKTTGDGLMAVFDAVSAAVAAAISAQRELAAEDWGQTGPLHVRMGMHVGDSVARAGDYYGTEVNRAARIMASAHGGQVVLSRAAAELARRSLPDEVNLRDLGAHRLKDLEGPIELFQLMGPGLIGDFPPLNTLDARPNNLPTLTSAFLGREDLLADLRELLDDRATRLVTLLGPGGTGKTRLALQAAAAQIDRFDDGVFFVDLSAEREPDAVFAAVARATSVSSRREDPPLEVLKQGLAQVRMLLVLDNFEQVTAAGPGVVELLEHCPGVTALVTSREALRVRGERICAVPPLSLPPDGAPPEAALDAEAVRLFVDRAGAVRPDFELTAADTSDVVEICRRLDGLPLAIELAAARINLFDVAELRARLEERLDVLKGGARDLPERQQTLRSAIAWSDELLTEAERSLFLALSVFVGARLTDVERTVERVPDLREVDVVELLGSLLDKSLVRDARAPDGGRRFSMLQTIRDYSGEHLAERPDLSTAVRRAHAHHYTELAVELRQGLSQSNREEVLRALGVELGNLRAAWAHWLGEEDVARLNELLEPLWGYHDARGEYGAAIELANDLLAVLRIQPETVERVRDEIALEMSLARSLIAMHGYTAEVERRIGEAIERSGTSGAPQRFPVLRSLATLHMLRNQFPKAVSVGKELLEIAERERDPMLLSDAHLVVGVNTAFGEGLAKGVGHLDQAIEQFGRAEAGLVQFRVGPIPGVVANVVSGLLLWMLGFPERAVARTEAGLGLAVDIGHPYSHAYALYHASVLDLWRLDMEQVAHRTDRLVEVSEAHDYTIWRALGFVLRGTATVAFGEPEDGLAEVERGFEIYEGLSTPPVFWPALLMVRATANRMAGRVQEALAYLDEADAAQPVGAEIAEVALARGDLLLDTGDTSAAEVQFRRALDQAAAAGARMSELMAATRLAVLRRDSPGGPEALRTLRGILDTFTEGFDTPQLTAAAAILDAR